MKSLFDDLSVRMSKETVHTYSTSFSWAICFLNRRLRNPICSIYGFVRVADEIVDSFEGFDQKQLLSKFREDTFAAIENRVSVNPILHSFQQVVNQYDISHAHIRQFLESMEMDLEKMRYTSEKYERYILGSAQAVGLMCLQVFAEGNTAVYEELKGYAMRLGAAFQKVNFLRDARDDYRVLGRTYFPDIDMNDFDRQAKQQIEKEIEEDFKMAFDGIQKLPKSSRRGVYLAYVYYYSLFSKIKRLPVQKILTERVRIKNGQKMGLVLSCVIQHK